MRVRIQGHVAGRSWWDLPIPRQFPRGPSGTCKALLVPRSAARSSSRVCIETRACVHSGACINCSMKPEGRRTAHRPRSVAPAAYIISAPCLLRYATGLFRLLTRLSWAGDADAGHTRPQTSRPRCLCLPTRLRPCVTPSLHSLPTSPVAELWIVACVGVCWAPD